MRFWALAALAVAVLLIDGCGGGGSPPPPVVSVSVTPQSVTLRGGDTQRFFGTTSGAMSAAVTWSVNGKLGGDPSVGIIDSTGLYTAPTPAPSSNIVQVTATSVSDPTKSKSAQTTLLNPIAQVYLFTPATLSPNSAFSLTVTGNKFLNGAQVMFGSAPVNTAFVDSSHLTITGTAPAAGVIDVTVTNPSPDGAPSAAKALAVGRSESKGCGQIARAEHIRAGRGAVSRAGNGRNGAVSHRSISGAGFAVSRPRPDR